MVTENSADPWRRQTMGRQESGCERHGVSPASQCRSAAPSPWSTGGMEPGGKPPGRLRHLAVHRGRDRLPPRSGHRTGRCHGKSLSSRAARHRCPAHEGRPRTVVAPPSTAESRVVRPSRRPDTAFTVAARTLRPELWCVPTQGRGDRTRCRPHPTGGRAESRWAGSMPEPVPAGPVGRPIRTAGTGRCRADVPADQGHRSAAEGVNHVDDGGHLRGTLHGVVGAAVPNQSQQPCGFTGQTLEMACG